MLGLRLLAFLGTALVWGVLALWWVRRASRDRAPVASLSAACCVVFWVAAAGFQLLALSHAFSLRWVVPVGVVLPAAAAWAMRRSIRRAVGGLADPLRDERRALAAELRRHRWIGLALLAVASHLALRLARALVTPTFGWDDFTYHLYRAARWVQSEGVVLEPAPDAWAYYQFFPWGGDLIWAWALIWGVGDALVPWVAVGIWLACGVTAYALARQLGQKPLISLLVGSAIGSMPSQITQIQTAYVDNAALFLSLAATLFLVQRHRIGVAPASPAASGSNPATGSSLLLGMSCGLGVLVKTSFLPLAAVATVLTLGFCAARRRLAPLVAFAAGGAVALPNLVYHWIERGSPFYPFRILELLPFNPQLVGTLARFGPADPWRQGLHAVAELFFDPSGSGSFLNLGVAAVVLLAAGLAGALRMLRMPGGGVYLLWALSAGAITALHLFDPANGSMLTLWSSTLGRLVAPSLAAWMVMAALVDERPVRTLLVAAMTAEYFLRAPWKWPHEVWIPAAILLGCVLGIALLLGRRGLAGHWRAVGLVSGLAGCLALSHGFHSAHRYVVYRLVAEGRLDGFDRAAPVDAWPAWQRLDAEGPLTIAATAGWDDVAGQNGFRYPLLGSRLQNRVVYVPITGDGSVPGLADGDALRESADRQAWLARLARSGVDRVFALHPPSIELEWIRELPGVFSIDGSFPPGGGVLARVDRRGLLEQLDAGGGRDRDG